MFRLFFLITSECNLSCSHCIRRYGEKDTTQTMDYEACKFFIPFLKKLLPPDTIFILSGGEPTCHKNFLEILKLSTQNFKKIIINSNGKISNEIIKQIHSISPNSYIQISIDGTEEIHDKIRGGKSFSRALSTVKKLQDLNHDVGISTTVNKTNKESIMDLSKTIDSLGKIHWKISPEQAFSMDALNKQIPYTEWNLFVDNLLKVCENKIETRKLFDFKVYERVKKYYGMDFLIKNSKPNCLFCKEKLYIYPDFSIVPCTCISNFSLGNLKDKPSKHYLESMMKKNIPTLLPENTVCNACEWKDICKGGCPGYSFHFFNKIGLGDIRCPKIKMHHGLQ